MSATVSSPPPDAAPRGGDGGEKAAAATGLGAHGRVSVWRAVARNPLSATGLGVVAAFLVLALIGPYITPYDPIGQNLAQAFQAPSRAHLFGTDSLGCDVLSRVLAGARYSVPTGFVVVATAALVGIFVGALAGFLGGWVDEILMRVTDLFLAFPALVLAMAIAGALGPSLPNALAALAITWWPAYARLVRAEVLRVKQAPFVEAARALGVPPRDVLVTHILPNCLTPVVVQATLDLGGVILTASALSFVGFGAQPPTPEWGAMISAGRTYMVSYPWIVIFPGAAVLLCVMGFNLVGDGLRDALDPGAQP
ncbi:MAG: ABC transporter permease [Proteobacteria bacterium]|nr:ABC transporter permease [Pseudomonadota bacterium]